MSSKLSQQFVSPWLFWLDSAEHLLSHPAIALAPHRLWQSILPGWIFAQNVTVNSQNSSSPETEGAIQSQVSYGKQLGKVIDALNVLIKVGNNPAKTEDIDALEELKKLYLDVNKIKALMANPLTAKICGDLAALQQKNPEAYAKLVQSLSEKPTPVARKSRPSAAKANA